MFSLQSLLDKINTLPHEYKVAIIVLSVILCGPFLFVIIKIIQLLFCIIKFNFNFILTSLNLRTNNQKNKDNDNSDNESSNSPPIYISNNPNPNNNLSLIELKMMEMDNKEYKNYQLQQNSLLRLEMEQKIHQNKIEEKIERHKLEHKVYFLEKEIQRCYIDNAVKNKNFSVSEEYKNKNDNVQKEEDLIKKYIPDSLKEIFDKISDLENVQLLILNKMMNDNSYYDSDKNVLYINPKDLNFVKTLLIEKKNKI